jgi:hypothetical protein
MLYLLLLPALIDSTDVRQARSNRSADDYSGVWVQHGTSHMIPKSTVDTSFLVGGDVSAKWETLEPKQGHWNWTALDGELMAQAKAGFLIVLQFTAGPESPEWIYDAGVPSVQVNNSVHGWTKYPYYLSQEYTQLWLSAVGTFAAHIESLPITIKSKIVAAQQNFGSTGGKQQAHPTTGNHANALPTGCSSHQTFAHGMVRR